MTAYEDFLQARRAAPSAPVPLTPPVPLADIHTPALLLDLDVFEENLGRMQQHLAAAGMGLRSHTKTHKCPEVARRQVASGAVGVCCATVSEAEAMADGGIDDILITSPVTTRDKFDRVARLACSCPQLKIVVDNATAAEGLAGAASRHDTTIDVLIDLDPGMGRTGVTPGMPALRLAEFLRDDCVRLNLLGIQMYAGNCMHIEGWPARREKYRKTLEAGLQTRDLFDSHGFATQIVSGGGTGTFDMEAEIGLFTDIQAGSYAFMDVEYRMAGGREGSVFDYFGPSLFVLVTAISQPQTGKITFDGGYKAFATDTVKPEFRDLEGVRFHWGGDEHGIVELRNPSLTVTLGDKLQMLTPHCDPTVNLYDHLLVFREGHVESIWPVNARGCSQ